MKSTTPLLAEFLGTLLFVLSILASGGNPLFIGATLALVIFLIAKISGGHVNPAVSFAMFMKGKLSAMEFVSYAVVQLLGAASSVYVFKTFA